MFVRGRKLPNDMELRACGSGGADKRGGAEEMRAGGILFAKGMESLKTESERGTGNIKWSVNLRT